MALRPIVAVAALIISGTTFSAVTLTTPEEIKIVAVNEQEVNTGLLRANNNYKIDAGQNSISVRYNQFFEHSDNSHDIVKSGIVTIQTPLLNDGEIYRLALINAPKNFEQAQTYKNQPIIGLYNQANQLLVQQVAAKNASKVWLGSGLMANAVDLTQNKTAPLNQPAPIYSQNVQLAPVAAKPVVNNLAVDQQLIQLWQKANKIERQKFMSWVAEQTN